MEKIIEVIKRERWALLGDLIAAGSGAVVIVALLIMSAAF